MIQETESLAASVNSTGAAGSNVIEMFLQVVFRGWVAGEKTTYTIVNKQTLKNMFRVAVE